MKVFPLLFLIAPLLAADLTVTAQAPLFVRLNEAYQEKLEAAVAAELVARQGEIQGLVDSYLNKSRFLGAFAGAVGLKSSLPGVWTRGNLGSLVLGGDAGAMVDTWNISELEARVQNLNQESDEPWGAYVRPLGVNLTIKIPGLEMGRDSLRLLMLAGGGFFPYRDDTYGGDFREAWAGASAQWGAGRRFFPWLGWEGIRGSASLRWHSTRIMASLALDSFTQRVSAELAPGFVFPVTLEIIPEFSGGIETGGWTFPLGLDTALRIADFFVVSLGGSAVFSFSRSGLVVDGTAVVTLPEGNRGIITDDLGVEHPGWIRLSGDLEGREGSRVSGALTASLQLSLGSVLLQVPLVWQPSANLGAGIFLGMDL